MLRGQELRLKHLAYETGGALASPQYYTTSANAPEFFFFFSGWRFPCNTA
jgi:SLT domain-containing protein